jgi:hypothetical protein
MKPSLSQYEEGIVSELSVSFHTDLVKLIISYIPFITYTFTNQRDDTYVSWDGQLTSGNSWIRGTHVSFPYSVLQIFDYYKPVELHPDIIKDGFVYTLHEHDLQSIINLFNGLDVIEWRKVKYSVVYNKIKENVDGLDLYHNDLRRFNSKAIYYQGVYCEQSFMMLYRRDEVVEELNQVMNTAKTHNVTFHWI